MNKVHMKAMFASFFLSAMSVTAFGMEVLTDARIKDLVVGSFCYIDNPAAAEEAFQSARQQCGDSNRFARILWEVAQTNRSRFAVDALFALAAYGTREQLPHLYSLAANTNLCCEALSAILRLEGVSSNSLSATASVLSDLRVRELDRLDLCVALVNNAFLPRTSTAQRDMALSFLLTHFRTCPYPQGLDEALGRKDAGYRHSRRRLANLRAVYTHGVDQWDIAYVTNAINELVAYPEQNLPE